MGSEDRFGVYYQESYGKVTVGVKHNPPVYLTRDEAEVLADRIKEEAAKIRKPGEGFNWEAPRRGANFRVLPGWDHGAVAVLQFSGDSDETWLTAPFAKTLISQLQTLVDEAEENNKDAATSFRLFDTWSSVGGHVEGGLLHLDATGRSGDPVVVRFNKANARALASYISGIAQQLP